jgi:hypothetical protein
MPSVALNASNLLTDIGGAIRRIDQPLPTAFLAESQFFLETLTLGLLVGIAWSYANAYHAA